VVLCVAVCGILLQSVSVCCVCPIYIPVSMRSAKEPYFYAKEPSSPIKEAYAFCISKPVKMTYIKRQLVVIMCSCTCEYMSMNTFMCDYINVHVYTYTYIYIHVERMKENERER